MANELRLARIAALLLLCAQSISAETAIDRLAAGGRLLTDGYPDKAIVELGAAREEFRRARNAAGEAVTLILIATAEVQRSHPDAARGHLQDALRILRERHDAIGTWLALSNLAQMERASGNFASALSWQDDAQRVLEKAQVDDAELTLVTFDLMASAFGLPAFDLSSAPSGAEDYLEAIMIAGVLKPLTHDAYAGILIEVGQYDRAEQELRAARAEASLFAAAYESSLEAHLGDLRYRQRRFEEARVHYEKALRGSLRMPFNPVNERWIRIGIHSRLAELAIAENDLDEALAWNEKSLDAIHDAHSPLQAGILQERGLLFMQGDRLNEAERSLQKALAVAIANDDAKLRASIEDHLSDLSFLAGNYGAAISHLEEAIRLQQVLHGPATEGLLWGRLAVCYMLVSKDDSADILLEHARDLAASSQVALVGEIATFLRDLQAFRTDPAHKEVLRESFERLTANPQFRSIDIRGDAERMLRASLALDGTTPDASAEHRVAPSIYSGFAYSNLGWHEFENGNTTAARLLFEKALNANATGELRAHYQVAIGACHWKEGNAREAVQWFSEAAATLDLVVDDLRAESMLVGFLGSSEHRAYYDVLIEALLLEHHDEKAFEVTERARARGLLRMGNGHKSTSGRDLPIAEKANAIRRQIENWEPSPVPGETLENLRLRYGLLRSRVESTATGEITTVAGRPLSLSEIWQELPARTTLISYFISPMGAHAWVLDDRGSEHVRLDLNPGQMKRVTCWAAAFARNNDASAPKRGGRVPGDCGSDSATPAEVHALLFAPLRSKIRHSRLMIVPHGDLHYVPFAALYDSQSKHYLVEDYTLLYLPSASALRALRARESPVLGRSLVLGDPDEGGQTTLPGANREVQSVAKMLGTTAKLGKNASEDLLYELDGKIDLLHIAAHGRYETADPRFSVLELAGSDQRNGSLTVDEILADVELSGINLVVLSSCQSGLGQRSGGDDVVGLTRAFLYAGSPGVIATLWNIDDRATTALIERFYTCLLTGSSVADALRAAQLATLRQPQYRDPYYWAAFQLTGDPLGKWTAPSPSSH